MAAGLLVAGGLAGQARLASIDAPAERIGRGGPAGLRGHLATRPRPGPFGSSAELTVSGGSLAGARLLARFPRWAPPPRGSRPGRELLVRGRLLPLERRWRGPDFDFAAHLRRKGIAGELLVERASGGRRERAGPAGAVARLRRAAGHGVAAGMPSPEAALLRGMVLGEDEAVAEATREDWRAAGLAHLLAVSGQNVVLLVALALPLVVAAGLRPAGRAAALAALIAAYVPLAGAGPSIQRAGVMGMAALAALAASRPASRAYALLLAAVATLALNPRAWGDPGWQLSFAAVIGIAWLAPPLARLLRAAGAPMLGSGATPAGGATPPHGATAALGPAASRVGRAVAEAAAVTVAATLATAPLLAFHFDTVPVAGVAANLLAVPAVAPAMWLGMAKSGLGMAGASDAAAMLAAPAAWAVGYIDALAAGFASLPARPLPLRLGAAGLAAGYALLVLAVLGGRQLARRLEPHVQALAAAVRRLPARRRAGWAAVAGAAALLAAAELAAPPGPPSRMTVSFLDVGQGDATLVQHPDGSAVLFDGGPPEGGVARLLRRAGVRRLDAVVATHASRDHHGGLREVLQRLPVALLLDGGDGSRDPGFRAVLETARRRGVPTQPATAPLRLRAGGLSIDVLSPPPRPPGPPPDDPNPRAVVTVVRSGGFELLLSGDAESEALAPLPLPDVDAIKVPHHGSSDPGLPEMLERVTPEAAAIPVGRNTYGHPAPSTLAALRRAGVRTWRTDRHGTVRMSVRDGRLAVEGER